MSIAEGATRPTTFTVSMPRPQTHLYEIAMEVAPFAEPVASFDLVIPAWSPGSYLVREYARNVRDLTVRDASGAAVPVVKVEKARWRVTPPSRMKGPFTAKYKVFAHELTVRTSHLDASHGFGHGPSLFFYVEGRKAEPQRVKFQPPAGWKVSIALPEQDGAYSAADYDELLDSPFECGTHRTFDFQVRGIPHTLALYGKGNEDPERLVKDIAKIVEAAADVFGGLPYPRYLFLLHLDQTASSGLEHKGTQVDGVKPWRFKPEKSYRAVLTLLSHEFFHAWNVKRIHPAALGPFDYTREVYTRDLWAMEGVTSYYEWLLLLRAGLVKPKHYFEDFGKALKGHRETPGTRVQSAELSSFDTWIRQYRPDENSANVSEDYYRRGALIGQALDLQIRRETGGAKSLDDVLRLLWAEYGAKGIGYPEGTYEKAASRVMGKDAHDFFARYVSGTETPPFEELFAAAGLDVVEKAEKDDDEESDDQNGEKKDEPKPIKTRSEFGWKADRSLEGRLTVSEVYAGRPAYTAGVNAGDELLAFDGVKADEDQVKRLERDAPPETEVQVTLFRRARLLTVPLKLGARRAFTYEVKAKKDATPEQKALYTAWSKRPFEELEKKGESKGESKGEPKP